MSYIFMIMSQIGGPDIHGSFIVLVLDEEHNPAKSNVPLDYRFKSALASRNTSIVFWFISNYLVSCIRYKQSSDQG